MEKVGIRGRFGVAIRGRFDVAICGCFQMVPAVAHPLDL